ncbi:helix-turn-helix domain-containing protein [Spirosoma rhododendri]|uniref:Helix-turn-helix transcriptional regulator n=1 Tax=Spirosoma rhododendri TaxID=2728024 RepID=A0A7L5DHI0_9BACT|nr:helix-turn-helix transcriptional regulator [Spirosoma rhododendri]QJD77739.1 helix-turn-helix transcriptional regulator [Spirosoma rhododendri]
MIESRIQQLIEALNVSVLEFARQLGEHRGEKVYHILHGRMKPRYDTLEKILVAYPQVNGDWLMRGEGLMFKVLDSPSAAITVEERLRNMEFLLFQLNQRMALLQETNDLLRTDIEQMRQERNHRS